jgi:hypothetical protein
MDDLIGRQQAIDALCNDYCGGHQDCKYYPNCENLKSIEQLPSAQPEIIRCKDCKHWLDIDDGRQKHRMCADVYGDWFCADAERRTDG